MTDIYTHPDAAAALALPDLTRTDGDRSALVATLALAPADGEDAPQDALGRVYAILDGMSAAELRKVAKHITEKLEGGRRHERS